MGQYIIAVVSHKLTVPKKDLEINNIDKNMLISFMDEKIDTSCYNINEFEDCYEFKAKDEIFNPKNLIGFLREQLNLFKCEQIEDICNDLANLSSYDEIIGLAEDKPYENFQKCESRYLVEYTTWKNFIVRTDGIVI